MISKPSGRSEISIIYEGFEIFKSHDEKANIENSGSLNWNLKPIAFKFLPAQRRTPVQ